MSRVWFFQANPKVYDIESALLELEEIWWRVPQHTSEVRANDVAVMWRSGKHAGIIGIGRITSDPQDHPFDLAEQRFLRSADEPIEGTTRVRVRARPSEFIPKHVVSGLDGFADHQIVVAPMGTVFPISAEQWVTLEPLLPTVFAATSEPNPDLPPPFAWAHRTKGVYPMTGGYDGYLDSLRIVCDLVAEERPTPQELPVRLESLLSTSATGARYRASFLRKVGIFDDHGGVCRLGNWAFHWREDNDPRVVVALLHSRCRFIGEMLTEAEEPKSAAELLTIAGESYGLGWDTQTQINNRRGWLQSAGMLTTTNDGRLETTKAGLSLLTSLTLHQPASTTAGPASTTAGSATAVDVDPDEYVEPPVAPDARDAIHALLDELRAASVDSGNPNRFEQVTRDVFAFLGFEAEWLGGAGRTDVLLDALLGKGAGYRVIIDCKSSAADKVGDQQIDWVTLAEHRSKHDADHVAVVAPNPFGNRLFERAHDQGVTVISVEQLAGLCRLHAKTPIGLRDYRELFASGGEVDSRGVDERAEEVGRQLSLASAVCRVIRAESQAFGRFSARDVLLTLRDDPVASSTTEDEIQVLLDTLASPLLGVVEGSRERGYLITSSPAVFAMRVRAVASALADSAVDS